MSANDTTVHKAIMDRLRIEREIALLIRRFEEDTGATVKGISVSRDIEGDFRIEIEATV